MLRSVSVCVCVCVYVLVAVREREREVCRMTLNFGAIDFFQSYCFKGSRTYIRADSHSHKHTHSHTLAPTWPHTHTHSLSLSPTHSLTLTHTNHFSFSISWIDWICLNRWYLNENLWSPASTFQSSNVSKPIEGGWSTSPVCFSNFPASALIQFMITDDRLAWLAGLR